MSAAVPAHPRVLRRLLSLAWAYRMRCLAVLLVQTLLLALSVLGLGWTGVALDVVHRALDPRAPAPRWPWGLAPPLALSPWHATLAIAAAVALIALARAALSFVYAVSVADLVQGRIVPRLRAQLYEKLQMLSFRFYDRHQSGSLLNRVTSDVQYLRSFVDGVLIQALVIALALLVYGFYMARLHLSLAVACLLTTPVLWLLTLRFSRRVLPAHDRNRTRVDHLVAGLSEALQGMQVIKGFALERRFLDELAQRNVAVRDGQQEIFREVSVFTPAVDLLTQLNVCVLLAYGGVLVTRGQLTVGDLVVFAGLLHQFSQQVSSLSTVMNTLQESLIGARRVFEVLDADVDVQTPAQPRTVRERRGEIRFADVCFGYVDGVPALADIDLTIEPGEFVALFGAAGAGKTSLLSLIPRFYDVTRGSVLVDGVDVRAQALSELRASAAFVFQESFLFSNTVATNIAFGHPDATSAQIERAARMASAHDFIMALPHGYDTVLGEFATDLSGGQRQRLALARALLTDPRILVLDDPTAALDAETTQHILQSLVGAARGRTTLLATHRPQLLKHADRVVVLERGRIVQQGTHAALLACDSIYRRALAPHSASNLEEQAG